MTTKQKKIKTEWIVFGTIILVLVVITTLLYIRTKKLEKENTELIPVDKKELVIQDYVELERAYDNALKDIEQQLASSDDMSLSILKQNMNDILDEIKKEKKLILERKSNIAENDSMLDPDKTQQFKDMLQMSKEVLVQRLAEAESKNKSLEELNQNLESNNQKLKTNLEQSNKFFEKEKQKNSKLNEILIQVNTKITELEKSGEATGNEISALKREKKEYEERLKESNDLLEFQNFQIKEMGSIIRKVNIDCYFIYEEGKKEMQTKIYLTKDGLSELYLKYFLRVKPNIHIDFLINKDVFDDGVEKVELKLFNAKRTEIFSIPKSINEQEFQIVVPNKNFTTGNYYVKLKAGQEDLILNGEYEFKIGM